MTDSPIKSTALPPENRARWISAGLLLWGLALAVWLARVYFLHDVDQGHRNHEHDRYALRVIEFRDLLGSGYLSPQWASHFRRGLGSPYFSYYQSGFFYTACALPWSLAPTRVLGLCVVLYSFAGYASMFALVRRFFGQLSGWLAASLFSLSVYTATEIYVRGDLSEFSAMMLIPVILNCLAGWMETGRRFRLALLALFGAALIFTHPAVALVGYPLIGLITAGLYLSPTRRPRATGALLALGAGAGLSAWYWFPVFFEWEYISPDAAFSTVYHYSEHFVELGDLLGAYGRHTLIPLTLGPVLPVLLGISLVTFLVRRRSATRAQSTVFLVSLGSFLLTVFLMTPSAEFAWLRFSLLERLQFPWRLLTLVTSFGVIASGACLSWRSERLRALLSIIAVAASLLLSPRYTEYKLDSKGIGASDVRSLSRIYFAPDVADEWMPAGASEGRAAAELSASGKARTVSATRPRPDGFHASVTQLRRRQGRIVAQVETTHATHVLLPHYAFPVGWKATLDGRPIELGSGKDGLMQVTLPGGSEGELEVVFSVTPMRALGLWVSGVVLALGCLGLRFSGRHPARIRL